MKKFKLFNILLIIAIAFSFSNVYAHNVTLDRENITVENIEGTIYSGSKVVVKSSIGEYDLYYQYVEISASNFEEVSEILKTEEEYKADFLSENKLSKLEDANEEQRKAYNDTIEGYNDSIQEKLPTYAEGKWVESTDNTVKLDLSKVPKDVEEQPYVLWIKVVPKDSDDDALYNTKIVLAKPQVVDNEMNEEIPPTGDEVIYVIIGAVVLSGLMYISYKKVNV